jgi:tRNA 5-methylaminomethyl-2-thiouridine biosynthesis bifunctional protein
MNSPHDRTPEPSPVEWRADGAPHSRLFDDVYFSAAGGLAEARAVFLAGCGLPRAWIGRDRFTIGELGFGSGLNIVALLDLWRRYRPAGARLQIFSVEAHLMSAVDARRALAPWTEVGEAVEGLLARWPRAARGFQRIDLPEFAGQLDLAVMDVADALAAWDGAADAWFLDGFSPARNPAMWSERVLRAVAAHSAPGARAATFSVAGPVRRGLAAAGFSVAKAPGFGKKRERLEARLPAATRFTPPRRPRVAIVGAGIAGAALARAFRALGVGAQVFDPDGAGAGASGNPAALVMPRLDAGGGAVAALFAQALGRAGELYADIPGAILAGGALQLETGAKDQSRFDRIAASDLFAPGALVRLDATKASRALGEPTKRGGLAMTDAQVVRPGPILAAWLGGDVPQTERVAGLIQEDGVWRLLGPEDRELARAEIICLAAGLACRDLEPSAPLAAVRGQVSWLSSPERPTAAIGGGYLVPTGDGMLFGATHDRDDEVAGEREADTVRNLALLADLRPQLAARLAGAPALARASLRAVTPDFLPLAGALPRPGLFILSGLGSRGFCAAPLLAEHVAARALGAASPLPLDLAAIVDPQRFEIRRRRRSGDSRNFAQKPVTP